ncbi:hypothetical protein V9T40_013334 [Parthenolecanium corni]|uniref:Major facilitator superfamily (MFS) profile domain-containing protein n=1 Tax=Parthenolecanium corni TaxID=536013 RepID=A0AAN9TWZ2_9HEMI
MVICVGLYIAEISRPTERGTLLSLIPPLTIGGTLVVYVLGYIFFWQTVALILFAYCLVVFGVMCFIPESYMWYMMRSDKLHATKALHWLRRDPDQVEREITDAEEHIRRLEVTSNYSYCENLKDAAVYKPFLILVVFSIFQQQVGYNIITYYAVDFFSSFESEFDGNVLSIVFAGLSTIGSLLLLTVIHKFNRKTLLAASGIGMTIAMTIGATCLSIDGVSPEIPILCVFVYIMFCMLGMIDIPWMIVGEMFATRVRGSMCANVTVVIFIVTFFNVKSYPFLNDWLGVSGLFWYFAIFSFLTVIYSNIFLPETKDKSLFEIEEQFRK